MSVADVLQILAVVLLPLGVGLLLVPISLWLALGATLVVAAPELWFTGRELDIGSRE